MTLKPLAALAVAATALFAGCVIQKPATELPAPPTIDSFTASATVVARGEQVTVSWTTSNASAVELREATSGAVVASGPEASGTHTATLTAGALFVLVARGPGGTDSRALSVRLSDEGATEVSFQAFPPAINGGESTTLVWTAPNATAVSLSAGGQAVDIGGQRSSGAVTVRPAFDTTYTLTVDGATRTTTVRVSPVILSAAVTPRAAEVGEAVTLSWSVAGAERVELTSPGRGELFSTTTAATISNGTFADTVPAVPEGGFVKYELAAIKGTQRQVRTLEVNVGAGVIIERFVAPPVAAAGATYGVRWQTTGADLVELKVDGITVYQTPTRALAEVGPFSFLAPVNDFTVELVATNARGGRASQTFEVDSVGTPTSATLTANPTSVTAGQPVTLTFASAEARRVRITDSLGQVVYSITGQAAESGTATVYPSQSTTYVLTADNQLGASPVTVTANAAVTVTGAPVGVTQFPPAPLEGQEVTIDSTAPGALLYGFPHSQVLSATQASFIDISATGRIVLETGADKTDIELPFTTFLWGRLVSGPLSVSRAGWMAWNSRQTAVLSSAGTLTGLPPGAIAPFWANLTFVPDVSAVYAQVVGNAPDETLIVQWNKLRVGTDASTEVTFQVQVNQRGTVSFQYQAMNLSPTFSSFTVGLQDFRKATVLTVSELPASNSAHYFFSPVTGPLALTARKALGVSGYVKVNDVYWLVRRDFNALIPPYDVALTEVMFRPSTPEGQYVEFFNRTGAPIDLTGWTFEAQGSVLPLSGALAPGVTVLGASTDPAANDDAGVTVSWADAGFVLPDDAGTVLLGPADAGVSSAPRLTYFQPADGGTGTAIVVDPGPFVGTTSASLGSATCLATEPFGALTPQQLGTPGVASGCGFPYTMTRIPSRFVDISDGGTSLVNSATAVDSRTVPITLAAAPTDPAPVTFGARRDVVSMSLDGWMIGTSTTTTSSTGATATSTSSTTRGKLAVFWNNLGTQVGTARPSDMFWRRFEPGEDPATPARHWVFMWSNLQFTGATDDGPDNLNFEVKLFEDGTVEYHYGDLDISHSESWNLGTNATVWLERPDGSQALVVSLFQPLIRPHTAFRFTPR